MTMTEMTIGQVAGYAGIQTSAIRYYEKEGLLAPPKRVHGQRRYDPAVLKRLGLIQLLRKAGFGIKELQLLLNGSEADTAASSQWKQLAAEKIAQMDALITQTKMTRAWLIDALQRECIDVNDCVSIDIAEDGNGMNITLTCGAKSLLAT